MKAAVLTEIAKPLQIMEFPETPHILPGQVLVRMNTAGICGAQIGEQFGAKGVDKYLPHMMGHEGFGEVAATGSAVSTVEVGDKVVLHWRPGTGCFHSGASWVSDKSVQVGAGPVTTFSEYTMVAENRVTKVSDSTNPYIGALMGCAVTTGMGIVTREAQLLPGQSIRVIGVGGVGAAVILAAKLVSAGRIFAVDITSDKLLYAEQLGATDLERTLFWDAADVVVDCTGSADILPKALQATKPGGKLILVGQPHAGVSVIFPNMRQHYVGKTIMDSQGGLTQPQEDIERYLLLQRMGKADFFPLIGRIGEIEEINDMMEDMRNGKVLGRCMIRLN